MCTGIRLKAKDGAAVHARTLEFGVDIHSDIIIIPEGYERVGSTPKKSEKDRALPGNSWKSKYASVGMSDLGLDVIVSDASKTIGPW
jgi:choloylglycine hydrolase